MRFPWDKDVVKLNKRGQKSITTNEYINWFKDAYPHNYEILDFSSFNYINAHTYSIVSTKYGKCKIKPTHLSKGSIPSIQSALDKNTYFKNMAFDKWGNKYDYSKLDYINMHTNVTIICPTHGEFIIKPLNHINSVTGCGKCGNELTDSKNRLNPTGWSFNIWRDRASSSKNFDSFKLYMIICEKNNEKFYKIGKTYKKINKRFLNSKMPYNYKTIFVYEGTSEEVSFYEKKLQSLNKENSYIPEINFDGKYECYKQINTETWNFIKNNIILTTASMLK